VQEATANINFFTVMNIKVAAIQIADLCEIASQWITSGATAKSVTFTGMHGVMESRDNPEAMAAHHDADLVVCDGMPLVWLGRLYGFAAMRRRVYGPEFMRTFCARTTNQFTHFFLGGSPETLERLRTTFAREFSLKVTGMYSPPFKPWTPEDISEMAKKISDSGSKVVWIGVGCPKQEILAMRLKPLLPDGTVLLGVGAAFDFNSGQKTMAPKFMRESGLEWAYRLATEPRRLWRRYLVLGSKFIFLALREYRLSKRTRGDSVS
jgi:N-acetylglucosaminyldiphosphoundecaprenol N-acetyl-beta-D-mannosaminyltransferase